MTPEQYHRVLIALDDALEIFESAPTDHAEHDRELFHYLELLRSRVLKAESGHPFPSLTPSPPAAFTGRVINDNLFPAPTTIRLRHCR